ncbi:MAG: hypothetical protein ACK4S0_00455 [Sediminibacterium sp.]|jgi:ABC-type uncharacterized transport system substrate-binding protein
MAALALFFLVIILLILSLIPLAHNFFDAYMTVHQKKGEQYRESELWVLQQQFNQQIEAQWKKISDQLAITTKQHKQEPGTETMLIFLQNYIQSILKVLK